MIQRTTKQTRNLEVPLTPEERTQRHHDVLRLLDAYEAEGKRMKETAAEHKKKLSEITRQITLARREAATGRTFCDVDCEVHVEDGNVFVVRLDTGETIERRPAAVHERQTGIDEVLG